MVCMYIIIHTYMTTPKHHPATPPPKAPSARRARKQPQPPKAQPPEWLRTRFSAAQLLGRFGKLMPLSRLASWLALCDKAFYERAFTPLITLWYLVFQRLCDNHHLTHALEDALAGGADRLNTLGKPLSRQLRSQATASFSEPRQRLPLELCRGSLWHTAAQTACDLQAPKRFGLTVGRMDGSPVRSRPLGDIPKHFPAHRPGNSKKPPYWCVARVVGMFWLATGVVLDSAMGALQASEQGVRALLLCQGCWAGWLLLGDRNLGVYSVARTALNANAHVLFRLTKARATKLARSAGLTVGPGIDAVWSWSASPHDQCPEALARTPVDGRLVVLRLERPGFRSFTLYLFTTLLDQLKCPAQELAQLYGQRWKIELCFRYIKAQMDLGFLECHSADMLRKEWLAGLIAYNLIRWTMAAAAALAELPVQGLSFSQTRQLLLGWLLRSSQQRRRVRSWKGLLTPSRQSPAAQTTQAPTLRASSPSAIPKGLRQTRRFQGRRTPQTRKNQCQFLVTLDRNVRAPSSRHRDFLAQINILDGIEQADALLHRALEGL